MMDHTLGSYVDEGTYNGCVLDGKPIHDGSCLDGVDGCPRCNSAMRDLPDEDRAKIDAAYDAANADREDYDAAHEKQWRWTFHCDYCGKQKDIREGQTHRCPDEGGSVSYEICGACSSSCSCRDVEYEDYDDDYDRGDHDDEPELPAEEPNAGLLARLALALAPEAVIDYVDADFGTGNGRSLPALELDLYSATSYDYDAPLGRAMRATAFRGAYVYYVFEGTKETQEIAGLGIGQKYVMYTCYDTLAVAPLKEVV